MKTLIAVMLVISCVVMADEIAEIREYYKQVMEHLDDEYGLFRTEISINAEDGIYPVLGHYQEKITFYWDSEGGYKWLVLVTWTGGYASRREYGEVLYIEPEPTWEHGIEEVVFQYVSSHDWDGNDTEYQWWYSSGELLQSSGQSTYPSEVIEFTPDIPDEYDYAHNPAELLDLFYAIHN